MKTTLFNSPTTRALNGGRTGVAKIFTFLLLLGLGFSTQAWADKITNTGWACLRGTFYDDWEDISMTNGGTDYYTGYTFIKANRSVSLKLKAGKNGDGGWGPTEYGLSSDQTFNKDNTEHTGWYSGNGNKVVTLNAYNAPSGWVKIDYAFWGDYYGNSRVTITQSNCNAFELKHKWDGSNWSYKVLTTDNGDGTFSVDKTTFKDVNEGFNWKITNDPKNRESWISPGDKIQKVGSPADGDKCLFTFSPSAEKIWITRYEKVTYNVNGGSGASAPENQEQLYNQSITLATQPSGLAKTGYTFTGWNTSDNGTGTHYDAGATFNIQSDLTLYAEWTIKTTTVTFNKNDGSGTTLDVTATYGQTMPSNGATSWTRTGYNLNNFWLTQNFTDKTRLTNGTKWVRNRVTGNTPEPYKTDWTSDEDNPKWIYTGSSPVNIYANWIPDTTVVTLAKNDGSGSSFNIKVAYDSRERIVVPNTSDTTRTGYKFNQYWKTTSGGTESSDKITSLINSGQLWFINGYRDGYLTNGKWKQVGGTATFYARWSAKSYNIILEAGDYPNTTDGTAKVNFDGASLLDKTLPTRTGYNIAGTNAFCSDAELKDQVATAGGNLKKGSKYTYSDKDNWNKDTINTITLYTNWTAKKCTLQLNNNSADIRTGDESKVVIFDVSPNAITTPQKTGEVFAGYYTEDGTDNNWGSQIIGDNGSFNANVTNYMSGGKWAYSGELTSMTLYAKWETPADRKVYFGITDGANTALDRGTISAKYNDGETSISSGDKVPFGTEVTITWTKVNAAYYNGSNAFNNAGWWNKVDTTDAAAAKLAKDGLSYKVTIASADIYAYICATPNLFDITIPEVAHGSASAVPTQAGPHFKTTLTATPATGYDFNSWTLGDASNSKFVENKDASDATTYLAAKAAVTVTPSYNAHSYSITYKDQNNVEFSGTWGDGAVHPTSYNIETATFTISNPSKVGYNFLGWYSDAACETPATTEITVGSTGDKTFYAKWTAKTTLIKLYKNLNADGGDYLRDLTFTYDANPNSGEVLSSIQQSDTTRTGYKFRDGFYVAGSDYTFAKRGTRIIKSRNNAPYVAQGLKNYTDDNGNWIYTGDSPLNLYAHWKPDTTIVTLDNQGATTAGEASVKAIYDEAIPNIASNLPAKTGYDFGGYYTETNGGGKQYITAAGASANNWAETNVYTLYAKWTQHDYTVTMAKVGSGSTNPASSKTDAHYNEAFEITATPTTGHHFVSWTSSKTGDVDNVTFATQTATTNATLVHAANATITATFAINHNTITYPTVAEQEAGHFTISNNTTQGDYQTNASFTATPAKGYRLVVTATDAESHSVSLTHEDFSYDYSFTIPATNVTISVTAYRYGIAYCSYNSSFTESDVRPFNTNGDTIILRNLSANTKYKFKPHNLAYTGHSDHFMGNQNDWDIYESKNDRVVTCEGTSCFVLYTGVAGDYVLELNDNVDNKPSFDVTYPNVSKINIDGNDYTLTQIGETNVYQTGTFTLATKLHDYEFNLYWQGARLGNNSAMDDGQHGGKNGHTAWTYESSNRTTPTNLYTTDLANGKYAFQFDASTSKLTAIYPSVIAGGFSGHSWDGEYVLNFSDNIGTATINLEASQSTIAFKVVDDGKFYGKENETLINSKSDIQLTASTSSSYDLKLTPKVAGDYTFTYDKSTHKLSVTYPAQTTYAVDVYLDGASKTTYQVGALDYPITAEVPAGMTFDRWVKEGTTANVTIASETSATTTITATGAGAIVRATFKTENTVYFKDNASWGDVWWYGYNDPYWDENLGTGSKDIAHQDKHATRIGKSDIWYYNFSEVLTGDNPWKQKIMAFTNKQAHNYDKFNFVNCSYFDGTRGKCEFSASLPLFVVRNYVSTYKNNSQYYLEGVWMKYNSTESGFDLRGKNLNKTEQEDPSIIWNPTDAQKKKFTAPTAGGYTFSTTVHLLGGQTYEMRIYDAAGRHYTMNKIKMTSTSCTNYKLNFMDNNNFQVETTAEGDYTFTISVGGGEMLLTIDYPLSVGDYRVVYSNGGTTYDNGYIIKKISGEKNDTASFYVPGGEGFVKLQSCASVSPISWNDVASQSIAVSGYTPGVYNFKVEQNNNAATLSALGAYSGDYYACSNALDGGWDGYLGNDNSRMTYSEYSLTHSSYAYNYYITKWVTKNTSVKFNVANKYSKSLNVNDFAGDTIIGEDKESLPQDANVRFMWNSSTNKLERAYISGSSVVADRFLVMKGDALVCDTTGVAFSVPELEPNEQIFSDQGNWVYQIDMRAQPTATATITAKYNTHTVTFKKDAQVIGGNFETDKTKYLMRAVYDFKTDKLVTAWRIDKGAIPIDKQLTIDAEIMLIRHGQKAAQEITFTGTGELKQVKTIYGAIEFQKDEMINQLSSWTPYAYSVCNYYISFPFAVKISEIFGIGEYGTNWQMQKYDGDKRAEIGWFAETKTFWTTMSKDEELAPYTGYLLQLNKKVFNNADGAIWKNVKEANGKVYIYFPSKTEVGGLSKQEVTVNIPEHTCTIDRVFEQDKEKEVAQQRNHKTTDSHWNMIGLPIFQDTTGVLADILKGSSNPKYMYLWDIEDDTKEIENRTNTMVIVNTSNFTFKAMHSYMAQYHGDIVWKGSAITPAKIAAPTRSFDEDKNYEIDLQILNNKEERVSRTYVELAEGAKDEFQLNEDVYFAPNTTDAAIYSFAGAYDVAANVLSVNNHEIPLGIEVKTPSTYTFHMPSEFSGIATLVDKVANKETILNAEDYSVYLEQGTCEGRFVLKLEIKSTPTSLDNVKGEGSNRVFKFIRNEQLYILRDGKLYNATGSVVE